MMKSVSWSFNDFLLVPEDSNLRTAPASKEHVKVWLKYKVDKKYPISDPDSSKGAREFYRIMWGRLLDDVKMELRPEPKNFSGNPSKYVQGDWMCSVAITFRKGLALFVNENNALRNFFPPKVKDGIGGFKTYAPILLEDMEKDLHEQKFRDFWNDIELQAFIKSAYTYANLIIVPDGFNSARSICTEDYWDRTLFLYFTHFNPLNHLHYKACDVGEPFHNLIIESFNNNDNLCLAEWIDDEYNPIMLLNKYPKTLEEWRELLREMTNRIDNRRSEISAYFGEKLI